MPLTKEFRLFFLEGKLIFDSEYWDEGEYAETNLPKEFFTEIAQNIKSNFFTIDVAQTISGNWLIIELGDGQVAGLSEKSNENDFYKSIRLSAKTLATE